MHSFHVESVEIFPHIMESISRFFSFIFVQEIIYIIMPRSQYPPLLLKSEQPSQLLLNPPQDIPRRRLLKLPNQVIVVVRVTRGVP
jgi:hypothetical protein